MDKPIEEAQNGASEDLGPVFEGTFAINKPPNIPSTQVLNALNTYLDTSRTFAPWLAAEASRLRGEVGRSGRHDHKSRNKIKTRLKKGLKVKTGHGGTLDPMATGVLIVGTGAGTKTLHGHMGSTSKTYRCTVVFGCATDSYDRTGAIVARAPYEHITKEKVEEALVQFRGKIMQRPPLFSALRMQGKRLHEYARAGEDLPEEIKERPMEVEKLELDEWLGEGTDLPWPGDEADGDIKMFAGKFGGLNKIKGATFKSPSEWKTSAAKRKRDDEVDGADGEELAKKAKEEIQEGLIDGTTEAADVPIAAPTDDPTTEGVMTGALPPNSIDLPNEDPASIAPSTEDHSANSKPPHPKPPACVLTMTVTSGFYVRSLCHDLGPAVGSLAHMASLVRTRQGDFELGKNVVEWEDFEKGEDVWGPQVKTSLEEWQEREKERKRYEREEVHC